MKQPVIRPATSADREGVIGLIHALNLHEAALSADRRTDRAAAGECHAAIVARIAKDDGALLVACIDADIVGVLALVFATDEPFVVPELRQYGLVTDLVVASAHRGAGIGRRLLGEAERLTRASGSRRLLIGALAANRDALAAYEASGFAAHMVTLAKEL